MKLRFPWTSCCCSLFVSQSLKSLVRKKVDEKSSVNLEVVGGVELDIKWG